MTPEQRTVLEELVARLLRPQDRVQALLFKEQIKAINDKATYVSALCTRRAGKSFLAGVRLFIAALTHPGSTSVYIALTRASAHNIMWKILMRIAQMTGIDIDPAESALRIRLVSNNSTIMLVGADGKNFIDRLRGASYPVAIIDEAAFYRDHITDLVDDVLTPAIADYSGQIYLIGTPGVKPQGLFYDATTGKAGYSNHTWSVFNNPHMPNARTFVQGIMERRKWTEDNPTYQREWLGKWVEDFDALVYKFKKERNIYHALPTHTAWNRVMAIDYGFHDKTAWAVIAYHDNSPQVYVEYAKGHSELIPSEVAEITKKLIARYNPNKIVADTGGLGKSITEEMRIRYGLPIVAADKKDKAAWINLKNGDFIDGNLLVSHKLVELQHQYSALVKDEDGNEDQSMPNDLCDAVLYAWRQSRAHAYTPLVSYATKEDEINANAEKLWKRDEDTLIEEGSKEWWEI